MAENDFLLFANIATNIESQTAYNTDSIVTEGFVSGTAQSIQFNKVLRQASTGMALLAAFIQQQSPNQTVLDQGATGLATLLASLTTALSSLTKNQPLVVSGVTATAGTTLTAAEMVGRPMAFIDRSGPTANYTDTTDTATNILTALGGGVVGGGFVLRIANASTVVQSIAGGTGVTTSGTMTIASGAWRDFSGVITSVVSPSITLTSQGSGTN